MQADYHCAISMYICLWHTSLMAYKRRDKAFETKLSQRADELQVIEVNGRVIISMFPALTFSNVRDAERFLKRLIRAGQ